jgi:hypothetical protein
MQKKLCNKSAGEKMAKQKKTGRNQPKMSQQRCMELRGKKTDCKYSD